MTTPAADWQQQQEEEATPTCNPDDQEGKHENHDLQCVQSESS
jgi:hypothetical protein